MLASKEKTGSTPPTNTPTGTPIPSSARGDEFAPAFEADMKESGSTWEDVDKKWGITGVLDYNAGQSTGGNFSPEAARLAKERAINLQRKQQMSGNTTYAFNPETMTRTQRAIDKFGFALDEAEKNPFEPKQYKDEVKNNLLDITSKELGRLFTNQSDIYNEYQTNPQFKATLDNFLKKGGTLEGIAKNVSTPASMTFH